MATPQLVGARLLPLVCFMLIDKSGDTKATRVVIAIRTFLKAISIGNYELNHPPPLFCRYDTVFNIVDRFSKYITFLPFSTNSTAVDLALLFYENIPCKFGMPVKIVSIQDSRFSSNFC